MMEHPLGAVLHLEHVAVTRRGDRGGDGGELLSLSDGQCRQCSAPAIEALFVPVRMGCGARVRLALERGPDPSCGQRNGSPARASGRSPLTARRGVTQPEMGRYMPCYYSLLESAVGRF